MKKVIILTACAILAIALTGCPGGSGDTFEIWLINTSDGVTIVNTAVTDNANNDNQLEFPESLAPQTGRVIDDISTEGFVGDTVTVSLQGEDKGLIDEPDATVNVPQPIQNGSVIVIVASGSGGLGGFSAEYVPLDDSSKGRQLLDHMVTQQL